MEAFPSSADALSVLGWALALRGDMEEAYSVFERLRQLPPPADTAEAGGAAADAGGGSSGLRYDAYAMLVRPSPPRREGLLS